MFTKTAPVAEPTPVEVGTAVPTELIPLSYVALDHPEPGGGWDAYLTVRNIPVLTDDLGRASISRADAKQLFIERRENEARAREVAAEAERRAVEQDRVRRAQIWKGVPADAIPVGVSAGDAMAQAAKDSQPKRKSLLEDAFAGESVFHPFQGEEAS
jgi:hypothetical protein